MNKRSTRKRTLVLLLTFTMILGCLNIGGYSKTYGIVNAEELATGTDSPISVTAESGGEDFEYENTYNSENFDVNFKLDSVWDTGYNATITITNTSDSVIENWCLTFPLNETISNIWNASVSETHEDFYVIKNAGWNQDIAVGGRVSFGITVYEPFTEFPEYYTIIGNQVETKSEDYTIDYKITEDWGEGYKAEVTITNNKATTIEDWRLSFEYGDNLITQIWNAVILSNTDGSYELSCETYNQNIAPGASVTFGFMVEPGCSGNLMENIKLNEVETDLSDGIAILFGYMEDGSNELLLNTMASVETERYEFYMSFDDGDFVMVGESAENEFTYVFDSTFSKSEIYAVGYDTYGLPVETNHIFVECVGGVYTVILPDTDGDGLEDVYEIYYGSDVNLVDTDGDLLSDYYEVYASSTYPTLADSDENGVMDGDEDYDGDGLSIFEECNQGTDPLNPDTDYDNLVDGEEINVYGTDPLIADWDEDGLVDGDEIAIGTDPLNPDTDEDGILDGAERFLQTYTYEVESEGCAVKEVSVTLEGTGNLQSTTYIESVMNKDALCTGVVGLVGEPFEIETTSEFDEATITFKIDETLLGDTEFEDLMFLWYDEEEPEFVELETILDRENMTVSVDTTHFSKYMVVDKTAWQEAWATELNYKADNGIDTYYTVLTIDCSGSMKGNDPITYNSSINSGYDAQYNRISCNRVTGALEYIENMSGNDMTAIVLFDDNAYYTLGFTNDKQELKAALQNIHSIGGTSYNLAMSASLGLFDDSILDAENIMTRIIFLSDGEGSCADRYISEAYGKNIVIYGIGLGSGYDYRALQNMSTSTGGEYYYAESSDMLTDLYEQIYIYETMDKTDNDDDGLCDVVEIAGIRLINGQIIYTDPTLDDTDGDELLDGQEINPIPRMRYREVDIDGVKEIKKVYDFTWNSDPTNPDSDGDGIGDSDDDMPNKKNYIEIASLSNRQFVSIRYEDTTYYGGNQGWWSNENTSVQESGCGIIAMCNLELYIDNKNGVYTYQEYKDYVNKRMHEQYSLTELPFDAYTLSTNKMERGLEEKLREKNINTNVEWAKTYYSAHANSMIKTMLECDIPVVASIYNGKKLINSLLNKIIESKDKNAKELGGLKYYSFSEKECKMNYAGEMNTHYFTITGIVEIYEENRYIEYLKISTWGKERYIKLDEYTNRLSDYTNFLYVIY